jgi:hypothetical protein
MLDGPARAVLEGNTEEATLGDTIGRARGALPDKGWLRADVSTQLAAFTAEGVIGAVMPADHKGSAPRPALCGIRTAAAPPSRASS